MGVGGACEGRVRGTSTACEGRVRRKVAPGQGRKRSDRVVREGGGRTSGEGKLCPVYKELGRRVGVVEPSSEERGAVE
jgi:hypothetical protein